MENKLKIALFTAATTISLCSYAEDKRPNIIFILADDMGIGDIGVYGQKMIPTPNIDKLSKSGITFTNHYSGSTVSAPSRCTLMTGKDTGHGYIRGNKAVKSEQGSFDLHLPEDEITVAELLQDSGYATMCVGKWGLGGPNTSGAPTAKGFDYFYGYLSQSAAHHYYPDHLYENNNKVELEGKCYSHFMVMDKGIEFIENSKDKPIFAYFALTPPHADLDYPDISEFKDKFNETPYINNRNVGFLTQEYPRATYAAMVSEVDKSVGRIIETLREKGELENSIIIFSSDNGVHSVGGHDPEFFDSNSIYRGWKRDLYEGGVRTPFIVRWSDKISAGEKSSHISTFWDFMPTVCDIAGIETPQNINGVSYLPTLLGKGKQKRHKYLYYEFFEQGGKQCVIKDGWKLVRLNVSNADKTVEELYNMNIDPSETTNLINSEIKKGDSLRNIMDNHRSESENFKF